MTNINLCYTTHKESFISNTHATKEKHSLPTMNVLTKSAFYFIDKKLSYFPL